MTAKQGGEKQEAALAARNKSCGNYRQNGGENAGMMTISPVTLTHNFARLEPLSMRHFDDLAQIADEPELWEFMSFGSLASPETLREWIAAACVKTDESAFAVVDVSSNRAVGSTSVYDVSRQNRSLEIGRTWLGKPFWRSPLNTECKFLLLRHAFESLGVNRVQIKTDSRNLRSQAAIERLGARREGVLRRHMILPDGFVRDTVVFSVISDDWPSVKSRLETLMTRSA